MEEVITASTGAPKRNCLPRPMELARQPSLPLAGSCFDTCLGTISTQSPQTTSSRQWSLANAETSLATPPQDSPQAQIGCTILCRSTLMVCESWQLSWHRALSKASKNRDMGGRDSTSGCCEWLCHIHKMARRDASFTTLANRSGVLLGHSSHSPRATEASTHCVEAESRIGADGRWRRHVNQQSALAHSPCRQ